jgi:hypothetical protein
MLSEETKKMLQKYFYPGTDPTSVVERYCGMMDMGVRAEALCYLQEVEKTRRRMSL